MTGAPMPTTDILIVEDNVIIAEDLKQTLLEAGYNVTGIAMTADAAVKKAGELKPDLIIMDIKLEGDKTGFDAATEIRSFSRVPIIFQSAYTFSAPDKKSNEFPDCSYVDKPLDIKDLSAAIQKLLKTSS